MSIGSRTKVIWLGSAVAGLIFGLGVASSITYAPARTPAYQRYLELRKSQSTAQPVSELGEGARISPIYAKLTEALADRRKQLRDRARNMSQEERLAYIIEAFRAHKALAYSPPTRTLDVQDDLKSYVFLEDIPELLRRLRTDLGMNETQSAKLRWLVCGMAGELGMSPQEALAWEDAQQRNDLLQSTIETRYKTDPFGALDLMGEDPRFAVVKSWTYQEFYSKAARLDANRAMKLAVHEKNFEMRQNACTYVISEIAQKGGVRDIMEISASIEADGIRQSIQNDLLERYAQGSKAKREEVLNYYLDPATDWNVRREGLENLFRHWDFHDKPEAGIAWIETNQEKLADIPQMQWQLENLYSTLARSTPQAAIDIAMALPEEKRAARLRPIIVELADRDPLEAVRLCGKLPPEQSAQVQPDLVFRWATKDPKAAAQFVKEADPNLQPQLTSRLISEWAQLDSRAASIWLEALPAGPAREKGVAALVDRVQWDDPESAATWTLQITNEQKRDELLDEVMGNWRKKPEAARAWVQGQAGVLGEERVSRLLRKLESAR